MWPQSSPRLTILSQELLGATLAALVVALALLGCPAGGAGASDAREWSWLVQTKHGLDADRDRLAARAPAPPAAAGAISADAARRERDMARQVNAYQRRLQRYLRRHVPAAGEPVSPRERAALHMRSDEEVRAASDFVARAGDYRRAIEIYQAALSLDPGYSPLERQLAAAKADRYVSAERFAKVKPGMAPAQVLALLGHPNLHDIREYPQRGLIAWFYPRDATGAAAAVWFRKVAGGPGAVFQADAEAVVPRRDESPAAPDQPGPGHPAG